LRAISAASSALIGIDALPGFVAEGADVAASSVATSEERI
jgi:hypothetical protein